jgi:hypothetical protein
MFDNGRMSKPNWRRVDGDRPYWQDRSLENDERRKRFVFEPIGEKKGKNWAIKQNAERTARLQKAAEEAALAAEKAAKPAAPSGWWFSSRNPASVAPAPTPTLTPAPTSAPPSLLSIAAPLSPSAAPPPLSDIQRARIAAEAKAKARKNAKAKENTTGRIKNFWKIKGDESTQEVKRSFWSPSTWFSPKSMERTRTFKNTTPITNNRLGLGTRTLRRLATNASAVGNVVNRKLDNSSFFFGANKRSEPISDTTIDLTDYVTVMFDTENKFTLDEKVERFKHIFLLIEIFEGERTIQETINGTQKNVFSDPKNSILNMFTAMPSQWWRRYFSGRTNSTRVVTGIRVLCAVVGTPLRMILDSALLTAAVTNRDFNKPFVFKNVKDFILVLKELLQEGKKKNQEAYETAEMLVKEGPLAVAKTQAEKENKEGKDRLEILIEAAVTNRYPEIRGEPNKQGRVYAALKYLEDYEGDLDDETILHDALEKAAQATHNAPDMRVSSELGRKIKEAEDAAKILEEEAKEERILSDYVLPIAETIMVNFPKFNDELMNLAKIMRQKNIGIPDMQKRLVMLRGPILAVFNNAQLATNSKDVKRMTALYCLKDINGPIIADVVTKEEITRQIQTTGDKVIRAVTIAGAVVGGPDIKDAAKLGAATAVTNDKEDLASPAAAAAAGAAARAPPAARAKTINDAINAVLYPLDVAAEQAAAEAAAEAAAADAEEEAAAAAMTARMERVAAAKKRAEEAAAVAKAGLRPAAAPGGGSRRSKRAHKKRTHKRR